MGKLLDPSFKYSNKKKTFENCSVGTYLSTRGSPITSIENFNFNHEAENTVA